LSQNDKIDLVEAEVMFNNLEKMIEELKNQNQELTNQNASKD
jgi:hypothetical protein